VRLHETLISAMPSQKPKEQMLQVQVPAMTKRDLAVKAAKAGEPLRMYVLKALAAYGVKVPANSIADRRKTRP
jgi:predicted HicB family RNase H-like nuclease